MASIVQTVDDILGGENLTVAAMLKSILAFFYTPSAFTLIPAGTEVANGEDIWTAEGGDTLDISSYRNKTLLVNADKAVVVYVEISDDNVIWYRVRKNLQNGASAGDLTETMTANKPIAIQLSDLSCRYLRPFIHNGAGSTATVSAILEVS